MLKAQEDGKIAARTTNDLKECEMIPQARIVQIQGTLHMLVRRRSL